MLPKNTLKHFSIAKQDLQNMVMVPLMMMIGTLVTLKIRSGY